MRDRFVDAFPQNTNGSMIGYYISDGKHWSSLFRLDTDSKHFSALLEAESKGDVTQKRTLIASKSKKNAKKTFLHRVPGVYNSELIQYSTSMGNLVVLISEKLTLEALVKENAALGFPNYIRPENVSKITVAKKATDHINEQLSAFYAVLLEPYKDVSRELYFLFIAQDDLEKRTPLHEAVIRLSSFNLFKPLVDRIARTESGVLSLEEKEQIALMQDKNGRTFLHDLIYRFDAEVLGEVTRAFNAEIFKKGLVKFSKNKETPIHSLCLSKTNRVSKAKFIRHLLNNSETKEEKVLRSEEKVGDISMTSAPTILTSAITTVEHKIFIPSLTVMFQQRLIDEANPLHLACQVLASDEKNDVGLMTEMKTILGDLFTQKMMEKDEKKLTPLDHAIKQTPRANVPLIQEILVNLTPSQADNLNPLHIACQFRTTNNSADAKFFLNMIRNYADLYPVKIKIPDALGNTPLHYAMTHPANTELVEEILKHLNAQQQKELVLIKNRKGQTVLDLVCQHGDRPMLELIVRALGPGALFVMRKQSKNLRKFIEKNRNLSLTEYNFVIDANNSLFNLIDYHISGGSIINPNKSRTDINMNQRRYDTRCRLEAFEQKLSQPQPNEEFRAKKTMVGAYTTTQHYFDLCEQVYIASQEDEKYSQKEYEECKEFFNEKFASDTEKLNLLGLKPKETPVIELLFGRKYLGNTSDCGGEVKMTAPMPTAIAFPIYLVPDVSPPASATPLAIATPIETQDAPPSPYFAGSPISLFPQIAIATPIPEEQVLKSYDKKSNSFLSLS